MALSAIFTCRNSESGDRALFVLAPRGLSLPLPLSFSLSSFSSKTPSTGTEKKPIKAHAS